MRYNGSKSDCGEIARVIQSFIGPGAVYVEPFLGSGRMMERVRCATRCGSDLDLHVINLLASVQDGWVPPDHLSEETWLAWKDNAALGMSHPMIGFAGYGCSFGGLFFHSYITDDMNGGRCAARQTRDSLLKQRPRLRGATLRCCDYHDSDVTSLVDHDRPAVVYCDPPYENAFGCGSNARWKSFDHAKFWAWANAVAAYAVVLVSEFTCPVAGARVLWQRTLHSKQGNNHKGKKKTKVEKLFLLRPGLHARRCGFGLAGRVG